jgi:hypothetical protein
MGHQEHARDPNRHAKQGGDPNQFGIPEFDFGINSESRTTMHSN